MKTMTGMAVAAFAGLALGGCAVTHRLGWHHGHEPATEVQLASCDAATSTLKGRPDHDVAYRACVDAKARQHVD